VFDQKEERRVDCGCFSQIVIIQDEQNGHMLLLQGVDQRNQERFAVSHMRTLLQDAQCLPGTSGSSTFQGIEEIEPKAREIALARFQGKPSNVPASCAQWPTAQRQKRCFAETSGCENHRARSFCCARQMRE
jgi:hypothetical protein